MPSGRPLPFLLASVLILGALGGCATSGASESRSAERRAAIARWDACLERQSAVAGLSDAGGRPDGGCEGHRRDVLRAFPPHMEQRLRRMMDERATTRVRSRLGRQAEAASRNPLLQNLVSSFEDE